MTYLCLFINIILLVFGQVIWKIGLSKTHLELTISSVIKTVFNPYIFTGLCAYGIAAVLWLYVLSKEHLSTVYPMQSLCYVLALFVSAILFKENVGINKCIGVTLIIIGVAFISLRR